MPPVLSFMRMHTQENALHAAWVCSILPNTPTQFVISHGTYRVIFHTQKPPFSLTHNSSGTSHFVSLPLEKQDHREMHTVFSAHKKGFSIVPSSLSDLCTKTHIQNLMKSPLWCFSSKRHSVLPFSFLSFNIWKIISLEIRIQFPLTS